MAGRRKVVVVVAIIAAVVVAGAAVQAYRKKNASNKAGTSAYAAGVARRGPVSVTVSGTGEVTLADRREIRAKVTGTVKEILVDEGHSVKAGDVMMRLQNDDLIAQTRQTRISYELALTRLADMLGTSADRAMTIDVSNGLSVTSKSPGRITSLKVSQGDQVSSGAVLGTIAQDTRMYFATALTEGYASKLKAGDPVSIRIAGFDGALDGSVSSVSKSARATGTSVWLDVMVEIPNPGLLRSGSTGTATFHSSDGDSFLGDGVVELPSSGTFKAPVSGTISKVLLREGSAVRAGDTILVITDPSLQSTIKSERLKVEQSLLELEKRQDDVDALTITAPVDGVVVSIPVELGNNIEEAPVLAIVADTRRAQAVIEVDELDVGKLKQGMPANITVDALGGKVFKGQIRAIAAEGTQKSGVSNFGITVDVESPEGLRTGMTASVEILVAEKQDVLVVPAEAVVTANGQSTVRVIGPDGQMTVQKVKTGLSSSRVVEITEGLNEGDRVVLASTDDGTGNNQREMMFMGPGGPPAGRQTTVIRQGNQSGGQSGGSRR